MVNTWTQQLLPDRRHPGPVRLAPELDGRLHPDDRLPAAAADRAGDGRDASSSSRESESSLPRPPSSGLAAPDAVAAKRGVRLPAGPGPVRRADRPPGAQDDEERRGAAALPAVAHDRVRHRAEGGGAQRGRRAEGRRSIRSCSAPISPGCSARSAWIGRRGPRRSRSSIRSSRRGEGRGASERRPWPARDPGRRAGGIRRRTDRPRGAYGRPHRGDGERDCPERLQPGTVEWCRDWWVGEAYGRAAAGPGRLADRAPSSKRRSTWLTASDPRRPAARLMLAYLHEAEVSNARRRPGPLWRQGRIRGKVVTDGLR